MAVRITVGQASAWRLGRQHLARRAVRRDLARAISDVCGVQAQVLTAAELAVRARVEGVTQQDVRDELWKAHTVVKTWCMRGTLHLLPTADLPLYVAALKGRLNEINAWLLKAERVTAEEVGAISAAIDTTLSKGAMGREELAREVGRKTRLKPRTKKTLMSPWGVLLRPAAYQGHLAFGENVGPKVTFVNPSAWVTRWREPPASEALLELFRRYLGAYGPAAVKDFGHWWGNITEEERSALGSILGELERVEIGRTEGFMLKRDAEEATGLESARGVNLLPSFDPYVMMYSPRELFVSAAHRNRIFSQEAGWVYPSVVIDGMAAGTWSMKKLKGRVEVYVEPFGALAPRERAGIEAEASDIGRFLGMAATVGYRKVS